MCVCVCVCGGGGGVAVVYYSFKCGGSISRAFTPYPFVYICTIFNRKGVSFADLSLEKGTCTSLQAYLRILHPFSIPLEAS